MLKALIGIKVKERVAQKGYTWNEAGTLDVIVNLAEKREKEGKKYANQKKRDAGKMLSKTKMMMIQKISLALFAHYNL